jgi:hypothetical protein
MLSGIVAVTAALCRNSVGERCRWLWLYFVRRV